MEQDRKISLHEYVKIAKKELDDFEAKCVDESMNDPQGWPMEMGEGDWAEQELSERFGHA